MDFGTSLLQNGVYNWYYVGNVNHSVAIDIFAFGREHNHHFGIRHYLGCQSIVLDRFGDIQSIDKYPVQPTTLLWRKYESVFRAIIDNRLTNVIGKLQEIVDGDFSLVGASED